MAEMPWFPLYAADFMMDTATWTDEEVGAYFRLLCHQWINGSVPSQHERLALLVSAPMQRFADLWAQIGPKFREAGGGRLQNARLERERRKQAAQSKTNRERARKAAAARWESAENSGDPCSEHSSEHCLSNASQSQSQKSDTDPDSSHHHHRSPSLGSGVPTPAADDVERVIGVYLEAVGRDRPTSKDRATAAAWLSEGLSVELLVGAVRLATARREAGEVSGAVRSLRYYQPVVRELAESDADDGYLAYVAAKKSEVAS